MTLQEKPSQPLYQLKPLVSTIRVLIAGGLAGFGISAAQAEVHTPLPVAAHATDNNNQALTLLNQNQTANLHASLGTATETLKGNTLVVNTSDKAIIDWKSFNIDKNYSVDFQQPSSSSAVLNNIGDQNASTIMGTLHANGQVYLVNQNGFVFAPGSEVNVNSLVATTLGISQDAFKAGISNVFNQAYQANAGSAVSNGAALNSHSTVYLQDNHGNYLLDQSGHKIPITLASIQVSAGAKITTNQAGGLVLLAAADINNSGTISADNGQVILAAAKDKVYLQDSVDPNTRGMLVEVNTGGKIDNTGTVSAKNGNISMLGFAVNQDGIVTASTSTQLNGQIHLAAHEGVQNPANTNGGLTGLRTVRQTDLGDGQTSAKLSFGADSYTGVSLDDSGSTAKNVQSQPKSSITISAHEVDVLNGATIQAHAGNVTINALDNLANTQQKGNARIFIDTNSTIDVSGVKNVAEAAADNIVTIKLQSNELRDSPLQRTGILYGQTVNVDIRNAVLSQDAAGNLIAKVPIADVSYPVQAIAHTVAQRSIDGGTINLNSSGDVIVRSDSSLDISSGAINFQGGMINQTTLIANGHNYAFEQANPNLTYSQITTQSVYTPGYTQSGNGGQLHISSYAALLNGNINGQTSAGSRQRLASTAPTGSSFSLALGNINQPGYVQNVEFSSTSNDVVSNAGQALPLAANSANPLAVHLNTSMLTHAGIQNISVSTNGKVAFKQDAKLTLPGSGSFSLTAANVDWQGQLSMPGGKVSINPLGAAIPNAITLGAGAVIDVSGQWINDWLAVTQGLALSAVNIDGGSVNLVAEQANLTLQQGSKIDASAGAWLNAKNSLTAGNAGSISLTAAAHGQQPANLVLDGELLAQGLNQNGSLTLKSNEIFIKSASDATPAQSLAALVLTDRFFNTGGFANYNLVANQYGLTVADHTSLNLVQHNAQLTAAATTTKSGAHLTDISQPVTLASNLRKPVNLTLSYSEILGQNWQQALKLGSDSLIQTDPGGSVTLNSDTSIFVDGEINTPGGNINLNIQQPAVDGGYYAAQGIWLGAQSQLLAQGTWIPKPNGNGLTSGTLLAGGNINLKANRGYIVTAADSSLDVSGTAATLQTLQKDTNGISVVNQTIASSGGAINFSAGQGIVAAGHLKATAGGNSAFGGSFTALLDRTLLNEPSPAIANGRFPDQSNPNLTTVLHVTDSASLPVITEGSNLPGNYSYQAYLSSSLLNAGKFASLTLQTDNQPLGGVYRSAIQLDGNVSLTAGRQIVLDSPNIQNNTSAGLATLTAPYVAVGASAINTASQQQAATSGNNASFNVNAQGIDVKGDLSFIGFNQVNLTSQGDLRLLGELQGKSFNGTLNVAGNLNLATNQVYPATLTNYTINTPGDVTFSRTSTAEHTVLTAGGVLTVNANNIYQNGTVKAPFGSLQFNAQHDLSLAPTSITSVSGAGSIVPFGIGSGGSEWLYPLNSSATQNIVVDSSNLPGKSLVFNGTHIDLQTGATINTQGGGDLYAYEFMPGVGGSQDALATTQAFAVLPGINNILTPYDPQQYSTSGLAALGMGASVYLQAGSGLAAGWYTLLPAHYALLPGAYLVTPVPGSIGQSVTTFNDAGTPVVAGNYGVAAVGFQNSLSQGFAVQAGSSFTGSLSYDQHGKLVVNNSAATPSQYTAYLANSFFSNQASKNGMATPPLPQDSGSLLINASTSLTLDATLQANPFGTGLGGNVDISGTKLEVVANSNDLSSLAPGVVGLVASQLSSFKAPSLLLGGKRSHTNQGDLLAITAQQVTVASDVTGDAALTGPEILLAATQQVSVAANAKIATGSTVGKGKDRDLLLENAAGTNSDGALLRVSSLGQGNVSRDKPVTATNGILAVAAGADLQASAAMLLDSSKNTTFAGTIDMQSGDLTLSSSQISLGSAPNNTGGLVLASLPAHVDIISLKSASDVNIYSPIQFSSKEVDISAAAINGFNHANATLTTSGNLVLTNTGAVSAQQGTGDGILNLTADNIVLGSGAYAINGFDQVNLTATGTIGGSGSTVNPATGNLVTANPASLKVAGNLAIAAGQFSGGNGATTQIDAGNHTVTLSQVEHPDSQLPVGLGVSWSISGGTIDSSALFNLPAGRLSLTVQSGDINLNNGGVIDLTGRTVTFANTNQYADAGSLNLTADGDVNVNTGTAVKLYGALVSQNGHLQALSNAGSVTVNAAHGQFNWSPGTLDASGNALRTAPVKGGSMAIKVNNLANTSFSALNNQLQAAGFDQQLRIEQQTGDLTIAATDTVRANQITLQADNGWVDIAGTLNASGASGGKVAVYGETGITLAGSIVATAQQTNQAGGSVLLDTVYNNDNNSGQLNLSAASAKIDVSGNGTGKGGSIHLRTGRDDNANSINVSAVNTHLIGAASQQAVLEAVRVYTDINANTPDSNTITADNIASWQTDTSNFMANQGNWVDLNQTGLSIPASLLVMPGIAVKSSADLTLAAAWDFSSGWDTTNLLPVAGWRYGSDNLPGFLTLQAAGNLQINASLSDGLSTMPFAGGSLYLQNIIQSGLSWSYNLNAGGNVNLAAAYQTLDPLGSGNTVSQQVVVRTGTGSIAINAGKDLVFSKDNANSDASNNASAVYTVGTVAPYTLTQLLNGQIPGIPAQAAEQSLADYLASIGSDKLNQLLRYGLFDDNQVGLAQMYAEYPTQGGDIQLSAGGNIQGVQTGQSSTDWLVRTGNSNLLPTAWGINLSGNGIYSSNLGTLNDGSNIASQDTRNFNQNVGALGGGNVTVQAGGNVNTLTVMLPTTGKPLGLLSTNGGWAQTGTTVNGGGDLTVIAGHNIVGGEYYVGQGRGQLQAGDAISTAKLPNSNLSAGVVLEAGAANFTVAARQDLNLATVMNPTLFAQTTLPDPGMTEDSRFFSYGPNSGVTLLSTAGTIDFGNDKAAIAALDHLPLSNRDSGIAYTLYPGTVTAAALTGDIMVDHSMTLFPTANGNLQLLANHNIGINPVANKGQTVNVALSDVNPTSLPGVANPAASLDGDISSGVILSRELLDPGINTPPALLHAATPVHTGSKLQPLIVAEHGNIDFATNNQATFTFPTAASIYAGGNISNLSVASQNLTASDVTQIQAGSDISYDTPINGNGAIQSNNQYIQVAGPGQLQVLAGGSINLGSSKGIQTVGNLYNLALSSSGASITAIAGLSDAINYQNFINSYLNNPAYTGLLQDLANMTPDAQQLGMSNIMQVLFAEITNSTYQAALAPDSQRYALYQLGYQALDALFTGSHYSGDINLVFSQIKTVAGGDINLLAPGGSINVGLAGTLAGISKGASDLGIVAESQGDMHLFSHGDVNVNQSRVFTLGGGNITAWSSAGNIDAGKGAKSAVSAPKPVSTVNAQGQIVTTFPPIIAGSGIQAIGGGNAYLAAPVGVVDAGEAGIAGDKIVIAATAVLGASNISASGGTVGVATAVATPAIAGVDGASAAASKSASQTASQDLANNQNNSDGKQQSAVSYFTANVVGFGGCSVADVKENKNGCGG